MEVLGGQPRRGLTELLPGWEAAQKIPEKKRYSLANVAMIMGTTQSHVKKTLQLGANPSPKAEEAVVFGTGRPVRGYKLDDGMLRWLLSEVTLRR